MAPSSSKPPRKYEVFLSFRGEDTRNNFVSHLYTALDQRGIITFFDEHNLESGQSISPELLKSIEESKFAIIVFSKNYASSTWCLDELVKIMECKTTFGQTVIPIFYDVDPSDVRKQDNSFGQSFAKHEVNFTDNMEKVQIWKENLRQAASIVGVDISRRNIPEASCIKKIVEEIFSNLHPKASAKDLVGIESRMTKLSSLLFKEPDCVCFVGIWGMGGIGKTTIARAIFDKLIGGFEGGCFLQDVSKSRMVDLQNILLSNVLKVERVNISDVNQGSNMINDRFCSKKVLLILDDVDDIKQLKSLAGEREWFGAGSRIIITTRDKHLLNDVNGTYEVDSLSNSEAMQLFSWHAFKKNHPAENFVQLSSRVVSYARGLPLALEVLGSYLHGRGMDVWGSALDRLKDAPEDKIFVALKISFEGLNDIQRDIFLDIACFFRGKREDEVKRKLHSFGFHPVDGITVLIQKSLIHMLDGKIQMHDLIQEMGWHIVRGKANKEPGRYSRRWLPDDIIDVLTNNTMDSRDYTPFTDDATFTGLMLSGNSSVGVNLSMDDAPDTTNEQHVDPSSPVDPTPPRRTKGKPIRSKSFKTLEDIQICKAWLNISMDPIYGNEQKSEKYWDRITRKYHENSEFAQRTVKSIQGRWSLIRASIAKWNECYSKIQNLNQSGKTEYDKIVDAKQLFMTINESPFQFEHCWMVLRDQPKFQALLADNQKSKQSKVSKHSTPGASSQGNSSSINLGEDDIATEDAMEVERPPGRKAEKARRGKNKETVVESPFRADLDNFHQLKHQQHLERMEQIAMDRAEREVEREERIMSMNLSNLEPQQVRYWRLKQEEVLKKYNPDG